jgi:RimJ/RimL family protein N-acetyltransferase
MSPQVAAPYDSAMADSVTIRPIEPADADSYFAVFEAVAAEGRWIGTEVPIAPERAARIRASAMASGGDQFTVVAVADDGTVIGFARADHDRGRAQLGMAILDGYRGMGIGRRLLDACIVWACDTGLHKIDLEVWPHNTAARRLYEAAGFVVEGRRHRHWRRSNGELWDTIEMSLLLDERSPGSPYEEE